MKNIDELKNMNILYVEDDTALNNILTQGIKMLIPNVTCAFNGLDGLEKFKASIDNQKNTSSFDIIITDINMPHMTGLEMIKEIRDLGYDIPIIITSAYDDKDFLKESLKLNVSGYSIKPINVKLLFQSIKQAMEPFLLKQKLLNMNENLEQEVQKRTKEIEEQKQKAEQANQTKSIFLSTMSHEIRTPLNAILGFIDLLKDKNLSTEQKEEYINIIDTSSHNLLDIINDILDLSKIESGNMELDTIVFSPKKALEDVKKLFQAKAYEKDIKLTTNKDEAFNDLFVHGDITKLKQIISNLLGNAIKFTPKNGFITTHLNIVSQDDDKVVLRYIIQDSGIGIDQDKLSSIFEPFKQEDETTTRKFGGTGLGLSIVKNMIELMGGNIEVASQKGEGAAFIVTLPFAIADVKDEELEEEIIHNYQYFGTVLVVDDVAINRKLLDIKLEKKGLDYIDASNGLEATQIFQKEYESISLIYLDINMPIMDGVEAVKIIKKFQEENNLNIPVIALTADAMQGMREKYLAYGFDDYLVKPIDDTAFELSLEKYLVDNIQDT